MPFSRSQNSKTAKKSAFISRFNGSPSGEQKSRRLSSSDFGALANQPIFTVLIKARFMGQNSQAPNSFLQLGGGCANVRAMTEPLAIVLYERLMPGSQLVNRLQDLKYRVQTVNDPALLVDCAEQAKPMLVLVDLESSRKAV